MNATGLSAAILRELDAVLRSERHAEVGRGSVAWLRSIALVACSGALFGAVMGSLGGKPLGSLYSAVKVPLLLIVSPSLGVPFFYVLNASIGLRSDFSAAMRGVLAAQGTLALALASLAPPILVAYASRIAYSDALWFNLCAFAIASIAGQVTLARHYRPLIAARPRHRIGLATWLALYVLIVIKLGWILRPLVGDPRLPTVLMRPTAFDENPYTLIVATFLGFVGAILRQFGLV